MVRIHAGEPRFVKLRGSGRCLPHPLLLLGEELLQCPQRSGERLLRDDAQFLRQPGLIHSANLIEQNQALAASMSACIRNGASRPADVIGATSSVRR